MHEVLDVPDVVWPCIRVFLEFQIVGVGRGGFRIEHVAIGESSTNSSPPKVLYVPYRLIFQC